MPDEKKEGSKVKGIVGWAKKHPAMAIAGVAGIGLVVYILTQKGKQTQPQAGNSTTVPADNLTTATSPGGYYAQQEPYVEPVVITNNPVPVQPTVTTPAQNINITTGGTVPATNNPAPTAPAGPTSTTPATEDHTAIFGKAEIRHTTGGWYEIERGAGNKIIGTVNLATLFPKGTTFVGASAGQAYANVPGGKQPILLTAGGYGRDPRVH